jgi:uncharacterized cupin superfamily protein
MNRIRVLKAIACGVAGLALVAGAYAADSATGAAVKAEPMLVKKSTLAGDGLEVLPVQWPKEMLKSGVKQHKDLAVYTGQLTASVYEPADGVLQFKDQPYDEIVHVLHGESTLTPTGGAPHRFKTGDIFVVPKGFTGTWEMRDNYREFIVIETNAYNAALAKWFPDLK